MPAILSDLDVGKAVRAIFEQREVARIYDALKPYSDEENLRLVGGSVRDLYLGREQHDLDFATTLRPQEVLNALERAHIRVPKVERAFAHGTVLAVLDKRQFEITTLRHDMQTDGRHAKVQFTRVWEEDAKRRDFTVNALYGGQDGKIYDFHKGREDMQNCRLRFIGNAAERIAEDCLRVLRFFRFHAELGWTDWDEEAIAVCEVVARSGYLNHLSGERLWQEFSRILSIDNHEVRLAVLEKMERSSVLQATLGTGLHLSSNWKEMSVLYDKVQSSVPTELKKKMEAHNLLLSPQQEALTHLAFFLIVSEDALGNAAKLAQERFRLSWKQLSQLDFIHGNLRAAGPIESVAQFKNYCQGLYDERKFLANPIFGGSEREITKAEVLLDALMAVRIQRADVEYEVSSAEWLPPYEDFVKAALEWEHKPFPISGHDLKEMGLTEGEDMGSIKEEVKRWWLWDRYREPDREECLAKARELAREWDLL